MGTTTTTCTAQSPLDLYRQAERQATKDPLTINLWQYQGTQFKRDFNNATMYLTPPGQLDLELVIQGKNGDGARVSVSTMTIATGYLNPGDIVSVYAQAIEPTEQVETQVLVTEAESIPLGIPIPLLGRKELAEAQWYIYKVNVINGVWSFFPQFKSEAAELPLNIGNLNPNEIVNAINQAVQEALVVSGLCVVGIPQ